MSKLKSRTVLATIIAAGVGVFLGPVAAADNQGPAPNYQVTGPYQLTGNDYYQISNTLRVYNYGLDYRNGPLWASAFTPNGEFHDQSNCLIGREQISAFLNGPVRARTGAQPTEGDRGFYELNVAAMPPRAGEAANQPFIPNTHHQIELGPITFIDHDHIMMRNWIWFVADVTRDHSTNRGLEITGTYEDTLERYNGHWLLSRRFQHSPGDQPPLPCHKK